MEAPVTFRKLCLVIIVIFRCLRKVKGRRQPLVNLLDRVGFWEVDKTNDSLIRTYRRRKQRQTLRFITLLSRIMTGNRVARCDECQLCYHFGCLDPPLKKSPKQTGYGWICQDCDTSSSKEEEEEQPQEDDAVKQETVVQESLN